MQIALHADNIFIANQWVDFRKSIDGLCALVVVDMKEQPTQGIYVFYNRARNRIKVLGWHGNGFMLIYKRLEKGKFVITEENQKIKLEQKQLNWLIAGLDWQLLSNWENVKFNAYF
jgi:transposase